MVAGGSWGSLLALAYAEAYPERVTGLVLRGVTTGSKAALRWWAHDVANLFPDLWRPFERFIPHAERHDLIAAYQARVLGADPMLQQAAADQFWEYSTRISSFRTPDKAPEAPAEERLQGAKMFFHYVGHGFFLEPGQLLRGADRLRDIPGILVQGRYDVVTRPMNAYELAEAWPRAELRFVTEAGHDASEPALALALAQACEDMKARVAAV